MLSFLLKTPLLALVLGPVVTFLGNQGQRLVGFYDDLPAIVKQGAAMVLAFALVALSHAMPGVVPDACANVAATGISSPCIAGLTSQDFLTAVLTGLIAICVKHGQQQQAKK